MDKWEIVALPQGDEIMKNGKVASTDEAERILNYHERLVDMVAELDELVCYYHGCFPIDRVTEKQRRLNDTMVKARDLLKELEATK